MQNQAQLEKLEGWLAIKPDDLASIRRLVTLLDQTGPRSESIGAFGAAQAKISASLPPDWQSEFLNTDRNAAAYGHWLNILKTAQIGQAVPIGQVFSGQVMTIKGQPAYCGEKLKFFKETSVIPRLCHDCYKVQILPENLEAMFQTYFLLLTLDLPSDNARKCMIELRDDIKFPYKAYVYCESLAEAKTCLAVFQRAQVGAGMTGVQSKISHGCSEYGMKYPAFKYTEGEDQAEFKPPAEWQKIEQTYFNRLNLSPPQTLSNTKPLVSLRDVFAFRTWAKYAQLIGDETYHTYQASKGPALPPAFVKRVQAQAAIRHQEMTELAALS